MPRGGKRSGAGRPKGTGKFSESKNPQTALRQLNKTLKKQLK